MAASFSEHMQLLRFDGVDVFECGYRVPLAEGGAMDYGGKGRLLVCDSSGTFLVENRQFCSCSVKLIGYYPS